MNIVSKILSKYKSMSDAVKASVWFVIASVLQKGIGFITTPIFTRLMSPLEYGTFSVYQSWYAIILIFTSLNLAGGVLNNGLVKFSEDKSRFVSSLLGLTTTITSAFFILYLFGRSYFNELLGLNTIYVFFMFLQLLLEPAFLLWGAEQRFEYKYKLLVIATIAIAFLTPVSSLIFVIISRDKALAKVISFVLAQCCIYLIIYIYVLRKGKHFFNKQFWKYALLFNLPLIPHYLSMTILNQSDRLMIQKFCGKEYVAIYSIAYSISMLMTIVTNAINSSFIPFIYKNMKSKNYTNIKKASSKIVILVAVMSLLPAFLGPELIRILASSEYYEAIWIIPPVTGSIFFVFLYNLFGTIEFYYEKNKFIMIASVSGAALNILLNYIFIPMFGFVAAGYTTLVCYILFAMAHGICAYLIIKKKNVDMLPFNTKLIFAISIVLITGVVAVTILYLNSIIRYSLLGITIGIMLLNFKKIVKLLKYELQI